MGLSVAPEGKWLCKDCTAAAAPPAAPDADFEGHPPAALAAAAFPAPLLEEELDEHAEALPPPPVYAMAGEDGAPLDEGFGF